MFKAKTRWVMVTNGSVVKLKCYVEAINLFTHKSAKLYEVLDRDGYGTGNYMITYKCGNLMDEAIVNALFDGSFRFENGLVLV